jgi:peptidoglycan/xylan/chitin deacetylase (PgdA/CDA1 family)
MWPGAKAAAVSLTYDDGLDTQLAHAVPVLDAAGLKGTFFLASMPGVDHDWALPNLRDPLSARHEAWREVARAGHELASHTVNHPCPLELVATQAPGFRLSDYDGARMSAELDESVRRLARLGVHPPVSFAYPCESDRFGLGASHANYAAPVLERFGAARGSRAGMADPRAVSVQDVPLIDTQGKSGAELRALVDAARAKGEWLVFLFHGIGEAQSCPDLTFAPERCMLNYLVTSESAHRELVAYLAAQRSSVWTAPFGEVARHIEATR